MIFQLPSGFIEPCLPSKVARPPSGPLWVREVTHDGYRLMVRRDGSRVHCFTRNGHDWGDRFTGIVDAALRTKAQSFLIDGEVVIFRDDQTPDFQALRSQRRGSEAVLVAFDLLEQSGSACCRCWHQARSTTGRCRGRAHVCRAGSCATALLGSIAV